MHAFEVEAPTVGRKQKAVATFFDYLVFQVIPSVPPR